MSKKKISIVTPCYNEQDNVDDVVAAIRGVFEEMSDYDYEHLFIDNASTDNTIPRLKEIAARDPNVKVIVNAKNFGHIRSHYHALMEANGDAIGYYMCDMQEPPEIIRTFVEKWEAGHKVVIGIKEASNENPLLFLVRSAYYKILDRIAETEHIPGYAAIGLYDREIIDFLRQIDDPYPWFRGLIAEYGYDICKVPYTQSVRTRGKSSNNFYELYSQAMLGFVNHSKVPLRLASFAGFSIAAISLLIATIYFLMKIIYWDTFQMGIAPLVIGLFFFSSVQLIFIGIIGEYVGSIFTHVKNKPYVIERERINF